MGKRARKVTAKRIASRADDISACDLGMLAALAEVMLECIGTDGIEDIPLKQRLHEQERVRRAMRDASGDAAAFDYAYNATRAGAVQEMVEQEIQKE